MKPFIFSLFLILFSTSSVLAESSTDYMYEKITSLENQLTDMTGTLEEFSHRLSLLEEKIQKMNADIDFRFEQLEKKTGTLPIKETAPTPPKEEIKDQTPPPITPKQKTPEDIYKEAYDFLTKADYITAREKLTDFLKVYPQNELAGNAQYWLGETYYVQGFYEQAAVIFAKGYKLYKSSSKGPDTLLKLGMTMEQLNKKKEACFAFKNLKKEFPKAPLQILKKAKDEAIKLKCAL